jgi:hypothetical protein
MGRVTWGRLTEAWAGEASDFTPELANHLDQLDADLGLGLADAETEVPAAGGRRIDILAGGSDGTRYVIENQYGRSDHDHLTRGLAYAVSADADGLIVVAEEHRDEFREVAHYLNDIAARAGRGVKVWLVEARAIRVDDSPWAPLFTVVAEPNAFTPEVAGNVGGYERLVGVDEVLASYESDRLRQATADLVDSWRQRGLKLYAVVRGGKPLVTFVAPGPAASGSRTVLTSYPDGRIYVSFSAFQGKNSGIAIPALSTDEFIATTSERFRLANGYSAPGWFTPDKVPEVLAFADAVVAAYQTALEGID